MSRMRERGQSAPLGVALLLGLTILGTTAVVAFGSAALMDTQEQSELIRAEQSMTLFDSQTAQVALGDSSSQTVQFGDEDGTYSVQPDAGEISIIQLDCDDNGADDDGNDIAGGDDSADLTTDDDAYVMEPVPLGAVVYETRDGDQLAYQGGGVWRRDANGGASMVSPPEFHYRGATLTLPVILARGSGGASGDSRANIASGGAPEQVFANASRTFPDRCGDEPFENPITDGEVIVRIQSDYAEAWGAYFESRTQGEVTVDGDVVVVELISLGQVGNFGMPGEGSSVTVSGAAGEHSTEEFSVTLRPDDSDSAKFSNLQWSMYAEEGDQQLEIHVRKGSGSGCNVKANVNVYYSDDGGDTYEAWHETDAYEATCEDLDGDEENEIYMTLDFIDDEDEDGSWEDIEEEGDTDVDRGDPKLEYVDDGSLDKLVYFDIKGSDEVVDPLTIDEHEPTPDWEDTSPQYDTNDGDTETIDRLVNHYFAKMPEEFDLTVDDKNSDTINEDQSSGNLVTGGSGRYVTYLHVTKNEVEVEVT